MRLNSELFDKIEKLAAERDETRTFIIECMVDYYPETKLELVASPTAAKSPDPYHSAAEEMRKNRASYADQLAEEEEPIQHAFSTVPDTKDIIMERRRTATALRNKIFEQQNK